MQWWGKENNSALSEKHIELLARNKTEEHHAN